MTELTKLLIFATAVILCCLISAFSKDELTPEEEKQLNELKDYFYNAKARYLMKQISKQEYEDTKKRLLKRLDDLEGKNGK